jgi:hypothetical protein
VSIEKGSWNGDWSACVAIGPVVAGFRVFRRVTDLPVFPCHRIAGMQSDAGHMVEVAGIETPHVIELAQLIDLIRLGIRCIRTIRH